MTEVSHLEGRWPDMTSSSSVAAKNDVTGEQQVRGSSSGEGDAGRSSSAGRQRTTPIQHYNTFDGPFFWTTRSPRRQYFVIHPEWASENIVPATWISSAVQQRRQLAATGTWTPPRTGRRCRSAPPGTRSRNPITWENCDTW